MKDCVIKPILSICIPTYNRGQVVLSNIKKYLEFIPNTVDIVVCDNGSNDNTWALLNTIKDKRIKIYRNQSNEGFTYNLMRVIKEATGEFVCLMSDEDLLFEDSLFEVLRAVQNERVKKDVMGILCETFDHPKEMSRIEELVNCMYGRVSYMSGILLNRSKMKEADFKHINSIYPHIGLLLRVAVRGRIMFSEMPLVRTGIEEKNEELEEEKEERAIAYVHPIKRLEQVRVDAEMVIDLDISNRNKFVLLNRIFQVKFLQGTIVYELIRRNNHSIEYFHLKQEEYKDYAKDYLETYLDLLNETLGKEYLNAAIQQFETLYNHIQKVRQNRIEYDELEKDKENKYILFGSKNYISNNLHLMKKYKFKVDMICSMDNLDTIGELGVPQINMERMGEFSQIVVLVSEEEQEYIKFLYNITLQIAHLFIIEDLALTT